MRYMVISDIHGNLQALEAVLSRAAKLDIDGYLCAGDLVGYGAQPNECIRILADLGAITVAGNHDLIAIDRLPDARCVRIARNSLQWTRSELDGASRSFLTSLPLNAEVPGGVTLAHGSLADPQEYVLRSDRVLEQFAQLTSGHPDSDILILGHTHLPAAWGWDGTSLRSEQPERVSLGAERWILNPGSVGQSRERTAHARFMVLDLAERTATFHAIAFDFASCRETLRSRGLPGNSFHLQMTRRHVWLRRLRGLPRRARSALRRPRAS